MTGHAAVDRPRPGPRRHRGDRRDIARDKLDPTLRFYDAAEEAFNRLAALPGLGARVEPEPRRFPGLRFWPIRGFRNYLVLYAPIADGVEVFRVIHGSRNLIQLLRGTP